MQVLHSLFRKYSVIPSHVLGERVSFSDNKSVNNSKKEGIVSLYISS